MFHLIQLTWVYNFPNSGFQNFGHKTKNTKNHKSSKKTGTTVCERHNDCISETREQSNNVNNSHWYTAKNN